MRRKRPVTGGVGSVGAVLVAAYRPALAAAVTAFGAGTGTGTGTGTAWSIIRAFPDNSLRTLREDKWYYVWVLERNSKTHL